MTLIILAAGMGSRYGGLKQLSPVGPNGETLLDYSVADAVKAGFTEVVFVIRREIETAFHEMIGARYKAVFPSLAFHYVFQELTDLPKNFSLPETRTKPWGTGHALLAARKQVKRPFAVINADDYYGPEGYQILKDFFETSPQSNARVLSKLADADEVSGASGAQQLNTDGQDGRGIDCHRQPEGRDERSERVNVHEVLDGASTGATQQFAASVEFRKNYAMVAYSLKNTLSEHGSVSRGICEADENHFLNTITERTSIHRTSSGIVAEEKNGSLISLTGNEWVSLNFWGFTPDIFPHLEKEFSKFLEQKENHATAEFYLPSAVSTLIQEKKATVRLFPTSDPWFGLTHPDDLDHVKKALAIRNI